jgi:hypothetical protein
MPTAYIKKLAAEGKGTISELEKSWEDAKDAAAKQGHAKDWPYVTSIFKRMVGASAWRAVLNATNTGDNKMTQTLVAKDNAYLDSLVESGQFTREEVDKAWAEAKKVANENKAKDPDIVITYAYTTSIFQDLLGIKQKAFKINAAARLRSAL